MVAEGHSLKNVNRIWYLVSRKKGLKTHKTVRHARYEIRDCPEVFLTINLKNGRVTKDLTNKRRYGNK